ncbi:ATP synthase gamma chain [Bacteroidia bacterium]|nr:ATP synthase gamma chain [Bacteroidia bacterium]
MSSLKELKNRISSVATTRKITQARQMISSAQLHRCQGELANARLYLASLEALPGIDVSFSPMGAEGRKGETAIVVMGSDTGMCGPFNDRMIKQMEQIRQTEGDDRLFVPIGHKICNAALAGGYRTDGSCDMAGLATYDDTAAKAQWLMEGFLTGRFSRVEVLWHNYRSIGVQLPKRRVLMPVALPPSSPVANDLSITEPSPMEMVEQTLAMMVCARLWLCTSSSRTSEQAARMMAMQAATENADKILSELKLSYNKIRQNNITTELLDIVGSSFA